MGLDTHRDRLCLIQLSSGDGNAHLIKVGQDIAPAPNLAALLSDPAICKLFHFARFDLAALYHAYDVMPAPVYCTKIASRLVRTYTDRHSLKDLCRELVGTDLSKQQQSSDWGAEVLSDAQIAYAASDVLYLHEIRARLDAMLVREDRADIAQACFDFLEKRVMLDLLGWPDTDIFAH